ncbi:hypothetical protein GGI12_001225 [Dipsacomyces acuminosporus]|nr:hypothetical protein GGI12_001225 [Dipsacomyces acuminosporus]
MSRIAFKSKVVSRSHAEIWTEKGQFFIKDTKSSSGTFLNHMRLSPPGVESRPHPLHDGDILQLGVDYQGGTLDIYKCVKIRLEINRNWQRSKENPFRRQVMENIQNAYHSIGTSNASAEGGDSNNECCICLYQMVAFQALFVAPCSHCFHFKCVKPILFTSTGFSCPLCRTYADLEASVTIDENEMDIDSKPPVLPPGVQQQIQQPQQQQPPPQQSQQQQQTLPSPSLTSGAASTTSAGISAAADAEAAVAAVETGGLRVPVTNITGHALSRGTANQQLQADDSNAGSSSDRDDANSTPVPNESMAVDSFGTTPVGSMPTNLATHFGNLTTPAASVDATGANDADASLVGANHAVEYIQVSSPTSPAAVDAPVVADANNTAA